ncbi:MAG TPA: hypothetical protein VEL47_02590 [Myxococcota bacterium]|nr:hypothetical protein [Myxococcota bacterium]
MATARKQKSDEIHKTLRKIKNEANAKEVELIELISSVYEKCHDTKEKAANKVHDAANSVNASVHLHPWGYIGGAALCGFLVGLILRR